MASVSAGDSQQQQQQTITWDHTDPNAWTSERVMFWLRVHNFGSEWKRIFKDNDIKHGRFLALANYRNLKALGLTDSVSKFIRLARSFEKPENYNGFNQEKPEMLSPERNDKGKGHKRSESATTTSSYWSNSDTRCSPSVLSFSHRSFEKYMFLGDSLRPRRQPHGGKHVALTVDNTTFTLVAINDSAGAEEAIEAFKKACDVGPDCSLSVHLTEYFCTPGEALSNKQLGSVLSAAAGDIVKFYIHAEIKSPLLDINDSYSPRSNLASVNNTSDSSGHSLARPSPVHRQSTASFSKLTLDSIPQNLPPGVGEFEDESANSAYSENAGSPGTGRNFYPDTPSYLISSAETAEVDYFNIRPSRLSLITETDNSIDKPSTHSDAIVAPYRDLENGSRDTRRTISSPITETNTSAVFGTSKSQRRVVSGPTALSSIPSTQSTATSSSTSNYQPSKSMQKSTAALLTREREVGEDTKRNLPRLKVDTKHDFQNPAFKVVRETGDTEINFDKPRLSPYEEHSSTNGLVPRRNAPPPPLARQASSKYRPELSPNAQTMDEKLPMVRGTSERRFPTRFPSLQRIPLPVPEAESTQISWNNVPEVSDEDSSNEDDGLWAIQPSQSGREVQHQEDTFDEYTQSSANNTKLSERVARPSTEDVYDNLEQFFPDADLDKPVLITNKTQPPATKPIQKQTGMTRMKSIRVVASEASHRIKSNRAGPEQSRPILRRKSTKMWGQKVVEMARGNPITLRDQKQYMWIKGELIGKGTFGKVFLGFNVTTGDVMAVKQVRTVTRRAAQEQKASEGVDNLFREVENMKDLEHPNIVQYLGFEVKGGTSNLFLEYVPGGSVKSIMAQYGRFQEQIIQHLSRQVLEGLTYLHSRGILHRDLKADNLLLDIDGTAKISDFGISKRSRDIYSNDAEMSMQGTIFWMAPEVIRNVVENERQGYSAKVDIWSFGCVVLEMFAGRRPWSTEEAIGAMYKLGSNKMAPPIPEDARPYMSANGLRFLENCFIIDPSERPTADLLLDDEFTLVDAGFKFQDTALGQKLAAQASVTIPFPRETLE